MHESPRGPTQPPCRPAQPLGPVERLHTNPAPSPPSPPRTRCSAHRSRPEIPVPDHPHTCQAPTESHQPPVHTQRNHPPERRPNTASSQQLASPHRQSPPQHHDATNDARVPPVLDQIRSGTETLTAHEHNSRHDRVRVPIAEQMASGAATRHNTRAAVRNPRRRKLQRDEAETRSLHNPGAAPRANLAQHPCKCGVRGDADDETLD